MVKRTSPDSDDESVQNASHASKRARTNGAEPSGRQNGNGTRNGKGKARQNADASDSDQQGDDDDDNAVKEEDEEEFEETYRARVLHDLEARRKVSGGIADHGVIEAIEMHQFMCHKYLTFDFGPQINFIIGHNGSGKSAVLSAITVALGGKANSTGRGNGLKSFIREGQGVAEVTLSLKNQGDEAFKHAEYGDSIVITRRFTKEGSSSWKIKSRDGRVISTKKDELAAICDHMNIQVDNPMNVLTQDAARQFLSASHPADKYKFFLRGTQLSQLSDEYDTCKANIDTTTKVLQQKKEALPDLRTAFREATVRFEEASKAREQKHRVDELKKELAWSHVAAKEAEMTIKFQEVAKLTTKVPTIQKNLEKEQEAVATTTATVAQYEQEVNDLGDVDHLNEQRNAVKEKMVDNRKSINEYNREMKEIDTSIKNLNTSIAGYQASIDAENARMAGDTSAKREEKQRNLQAAKDAVEAAQKNSSELAEKIHIQKAENTSIQARGEPLERNVKEIQDQILHCDQMLNRVSSSEKNKLVAYGTNIPAVLRTIAQTRWVGDSPIGPLGLHVKAKDPDAWGALLRGQLGGYLTAFAVTDARDQKTLKAILRDSGNGHLLIFTFEKDMFDYSRGEPPENLLTVLRALEINDPFVLRILINQARIEKIFLAPTRREGEEVLRSVQGGGSAWTADGHNPRRYPEGGESTQPLNLRRTNDGTNLLLTGRDAKTEKAHFEREKAQAEERLHTANGELNALKAQYARGRQELNRLEHQHRQADANVRHAKQKLHDLQTEINEETPLNISALEEARQEAEVEKESYKAQFSTLVEEKQAVDDDQKRLLTQKNDIQRQIEEYDETRQAATTKVENAVQARLKAQSAVRHWEKKLEEAQAAVAVAEDAAKVLQEEFAGWTLRAEDYCERVENPRKTEAVQKVLDSVQKALAERERRHGATVEEMTIEVNRARAKLDAADKDLKQMTTLNKTLRASLTARFARWQEFRRHIALRCKLVFQYHLSHRGYYGKVLFDHKEGKLELKVQTDDQVQTQGVRDKDPRSLSGGEKSFSTICLLLSLWESIGCPLRCLDEFDVFMDAINRRISMRMMIDTANQSDKKQYVLITPQDMGNIPIEDSVRVHRMTDPERMKGAFAAFSSSS